MSHGDMFLDYIHDFEHVRNQLSKIHFTARIL